MSDILATFIFYLIRFYQILISPLLPAHCRFYPTCSNYGIKAVRYHGGVRGRWMTNKRICRCHPWGGSGIDFVPLPLYRYHFHFVASEKNSFHNQVLSGVGVRKVAKIV